MYQSDCMQYSILFFIKISLFSKTVYWNPAKMYFPEIYEINNYCYYYYYYCYDDDDDDDDDDHNCYCIFTHCWKKKVSRNLEKKS